MAQPLRSRSLSDNPDRLLAPDRFLITGCASGIGRRLAGEVLARGWRVLATDVDADALAAAAAEDGWPGNRARTDRLDVRNPDDWEHAMSSNTASASCRWSAANARLSLCNPSFSRSPLKSSFS
ncbi:MAG: SDR family NAD(P)-dependent oxidoreductase [bacterium]|nr:SDR family NAD(P)-dependent oxidoreductase [bacterium]